MNSTEHLCVDLQQKVIKFWQSLETCHVLPLRPYTLVFTASGSLQTVYIQGKRADAGSNFLYDDDSQILYFKWDQNEPSTGASDLKIRTNQSTNLWSAVDGTDKASYICEIYDTSGG